MVDVQRSSTAALLLGTERTTGAEVLRFTRSPGPSLTDGNDDTNGDANNDTPASRGRNREEVEPARPLFRRVATVNGMFVRVQTLVLGDVQSGERLHTE